MKKCINLYCLLGVIFLCGFTNAQTIEVIRLHESDTSTHVIKVWHKAGNKKLVVLLPPYGQDHNYYDASELPDILLQQGIDFGVAHPGYTGYFEMKDIQMLDSLIAMACNKYSYTKQKIALGGFSAGGYGALRYALVQLKTKSLSVLPAVLFSVDAPLDLERWYKGMDLFLKRVHDPDNINYGESAFLTGMFRERFHGSPSEVPETYRELSVVSASLPDGGNAKHFVNIPICLYSEPDMNYYIEQGLDYYSINSADQVALANILKILGNKNVSLILTSGKGYRPDLGNIRMPHAWSIVNEAELAQWLIKYLN